MPSYVAYPLVVTPPGRYTPAVIFAFYLPLPPPLPFSLSLAVSCARVKLNLAKFVRGEDLISTIKRASAERAIPGNGYLLVDYTISCKSRGEANVASLPRRPGGRFRARVSSAHPGRMDNEDKYSYPTAPHGRRFLRQPFPRPVPRRGVYQRDGNLCRSDRRHDVT